VTADQLGTPRAVTDGTGTVIWSWAYQGNPFGEQQPTSLAGYVLNLRYPGQYYDAETGTNYNMFRTYDPATGRYLQSDPIGLAGGISTFGYVGGNPLRSIDPLGLCDQDRCKQLRDKINQLRNELAKRYGDLQANELGLPLTGPMSIGGHQQQFENKQTQLRKLLNDFDTQGCNGGLPPDAWEYATKDAPSPLNSNPAHAPGSSVRNALIGTGLFIGGVIVFIGNAASEVL
jgi:RHS repeat-associated protein